VLLSCGTDCWKDLRSPEAGGMKMLLEVWLVYCYSPLAEREKEGRLESQCMSIIVILCWVSLRACTSI